MYHVMTLGNHADTISHENVDQCFTQILTLNHANKPAKVDSSVMLETQPKFARIVIYVRSHIHL
jgi:hypothetical protein